jgi:hypothetical protein
MVQITVQGKTYLLDGDASMEEAKQEVLNVVRAAPAFLSLRTILGVHVEVMITTMTSVVLEQHDETPLPGIPYADVDEPDYDDIYGLDYA